MKLSQKLFKIASIIETRAIMKKAEMYENRCWITPRGKIIKVKGDHDAFAKNVLKKTHKELLENGWARTGLIIPDGVFYIELSNTSLQNSTLIHTIEDMIEDFEGSFYSIAVEAGRKGYSIPKDEYEGDLLQAITNNRV